MGLMAPEEVPETTDRDALGRLLTHAHRAGIARGLVKEATSTYDEGRLGTLLDDLQEALAQSPVPELEWPALGRVFDAEHLAGLLGISPSSLRRYESGARPTPDDVAARLHFIALVVGDLAGSYNDIGVRRWFERRRSQLDGRAPVELLTGTWTPEDPGPSRVRALAAALLGSPVT